MKKSIQFSKFNLIFIFISVFLLTWAVCCLHTNSLSLHSLLFQTALSCFLECLLCVIIWKVCTGTFFSLFLFYFLSFVCFTMGQGFLHMIGIEFEYADVYSLVSLDTMLQAHVFTMFCIFFLFEGALLAISHNHAVDCVQDEINLGKAGILLGIVSIIPMTLFLGQLIVGYMSGGYAYAFDSVSNASGVMRIVSKLYPFFIPAMVMVSIQYADFRSKTASILLFFVGIIYFFMGERTGAVSIFLALFFLKKTKKEERSFKHVSPLGIILLSIGIGIFIPAVGALRNTGTMSFGALVNAVVDNGIFESFLNTFAVLGFSQFPLGKVIDIVPRLKPYSLGQSYLFAFSSLVPNVFGEAGSHVARKYASLANWLMDYLDMSYGPGFSFPAEAWYNFGWIGCLVFLAFGYVFCLFLFIPRMKKVSNLRLYIAIAFFLETITSPRRDLMTVVRLTGYYVFLPVLALYILNLISKHINFRSN